jgi:hypothetical protein
MRVFTAASLAAASLAIATSGCSSMKMPSLPTFGKKKPATTTDGPQLTNAPPAPTSGTTAGTAPGANMPSQWSNLPMYPGTSYPTTPHPAPAIAQAQHTAAPYGAPQAAPAYGTMPPQAAPATAYSPYPTSQAPAAQPQGGSYAAGVPAAQTPAAPAYAQQAPAYTAPANPYAAPANPYAAPANPYAAPPAAQNAANPYAGSVTR